MIEPRHVAEAPHASSDLLPLHLADLEASAIPQEAIVAAGIRRMDDHEARDFGFWRRDGSLAGLLFPYLDVPTGRFSTRYARLKPDHCVEGRKYLSPLGEAPRFYFTPGTTLAELADITIPIIIAEGEKKTLSVAAWAQRTGRHCLVIGIGGCSAWRRRTRVLQPDGTLGKGDSRPIADFDLIAWTERDVVIALDGDVVTNWRVRAAEKAFLRELARRGV
jgi:hypothetical protein